MAKTTRRRLGPLHDAELSADELAVLHVWRQLTPEDQGHVRWMLLTLRAGGASAQHLMGLLELLLGTEPRRSGPTTTSRTSSKRPGGLMRQHGFRPAPQTKAEWLRRAFSPEDPTFPLDAELEAQIPKDLPGEIPQTWEELYADVKLPTPRAAKRSRPRGDVPYDVSTDE